jgi:hypothetical protein
LLQLPQRQRWQRQSQLQLRGHQACHQLHVLLVMLVQQLL